MPAENTTLLSRAEVETRVDDVFAIVEGIIGSGLDLQAAGDTIYGLGNALYEQLPGDAAGHMFDTFADMFAKLRGLSKNVVDVASPGFTAWRKDHSEMEVIYVDESGILLMDGNGADWLADGFEFYAWGLFQA